jgi:hypothetical protein
MARGSAPSTQIFFRASTARAAVAEAAVILENPGMDSEPAAADPTATGLENE